MDNNLGNALSVRRAPATAVSTTPASAPISRVRPSHDRQPLRISDRSRSLSAVTALLRPPSHGRREERYERTPSGERRVAGVPPGGLAPLRSVLSGLGRAAGEA